MREVPLLRLVPVDEGECRNVYTKRFGIAPRPPALLRKIEDSDRSKYRIISLKLCESIEDVVDLDDLDEETFEDSGIIVHAKRKDGDGPLVCNFILGRRHETGIFFSCISRSCCRVILRQSGGQVVAELTMNIIRKKHKCHLNGKQVESSIGEAAVLSDGDILSLHGPYGFAYRVEITTTATTCESNLASPSPKKKLKSDAPPKDDESKREVVHQDVANEARKNQLKDFECPFCYCIIVKAAVAQPSGQAFCKECLDDHLNGSASWVDGKPIEGQTPSKVLDSIIFNAALQGQFDKEDADEYLKRREEMGFDPPTERERDNILGVGKATAKPSVTLSPSQIPTARNWNKNRNSVVSEGSSNENDVIEILD